MPLKRTLLALSLSTLLGTSLSGCSDSKTPAMADSSTPTTATPAATPAAQNPFFAPSTLPFQAPAFDQIRIEHYGPALAEGMKQHLAEVEAIAANPEPPTVENTIVALEKAGALLTRVSKVFFNLTESNSNEQIQAIQKEYAPKLAEHQDNILLNAALFARIDALKSQAATLNLDAETARLLDRYHAQFVRAGAKLNAEQQAELRQLNSRQSTLMTQFSENLLKDTEDLAVVFDTAEALKGLSEGEIAAAAEEAKARGHEGKWVLTLQLPTSQGILAQLENRDSRRRVYEASISRGARGNAYDNRALVLELASLRARRAALLGYPNHAAWVLADQMAGTPEAVHRLMGGMVPAIVARAKAEAADIQAVIDAEGGGFRAEPWDWAWYAEKVRQQKYDLDSNALKPYFEFERVLKDGLFFAMEKLYGIRFVERKDLPVYHPDVRVFDVLDADGSQLGLFYADYFARQGKRGGAWMDSFVDQNGLTGTKPVVVNVMGIVKASGGEPTLLGYDDVQTMFHEMGHAIHGLFSATKYPLLSGTNVPRDYVEFPSQANEDWALDTTVLTNYARHYQTGEVLPEALLKKLQAARSFNQGFASLEYIAAAELDMAWHELTEAPKDVLAFEQEALKQAGVDFPLVPPRYRSSYFMHVFPGGYSAGYYAYLWAEALAADAFRHQMQLGGLQREVGDAYRAAILSRGYTLPPMEAYRAWRGADPTPDALLIRRGLKEG